MTARAEAPWITAPFGLVSLKEIVALITAAGDWPPDRIILGPLVNALYALGSIETHGLSALSAKDAIGVSVILKIGADSLDGWGFVATCGAFRDLAELVEGHVVRGLESLHSRESIPTFCMLARQSLMHELEARVFLPVQPEYARYYREPLRDWEEVVDRFPQAISDVEEASKCYALGRYAASVYHLMQTLEHGLLALGVFMQVNDPKSGFTAVSNALQRVIDKKYQDRTDFERQHFAFFEQINGSVQAMKTAWRNKIDHAQSVPVLLSSDFTPAIAMEIHMATRGFMRRLATDLPR